MARGGPQGKQNFQQQQFLFLFVLDDTLLSKNKHFYAIKCLLNYVLIKPILLSSTLNSYRYSKKKFLCNCIEQKFDAHPI
jgi:hypothetical protein